MKRFLVVLGATLAVTLGVMASPAQAHRWSYENALNDARWSIIDSCGGGWYSCLVRYTPYLSACTEHSWCWGYNHDMQYIETHVVTRYKHNCHQHAKQYHGGVYVEATDICGPTYAKKVARTSGWRPPPKPVERQMQVEVRSYEDRGERWLPFLRSPWATSVKAYTEAL